MTSDEPTVSRPRRPSPFPRAEVVAAASAAPKVEPVVEEPSVEAQLHVPEVPEADHFEDEQRADEPAVLEPSDEGAPPRFALTPARGIAGGVLAVLIVLLSLVVSDRSGNYGGGSGISSNAQSALKRADQGATQLWSYDYHSLDSEVTAALAYATPTFKASFRTLVEKVVKPSVESNKVVVTSRVTNSAVVSSSQSTVIALLFADQTISSSAAKTATQVVSAQVTMKRMNGSWMIDNVVSL